MPDINSETMHGFIINFILNLTSYTIDTLLIYWVFNEWGEVQMTFPQVFCLVAFFRSYENYLNKEKV